MNLAQLLKNLSAMAIIALTGASMGQENALDNFLLGDKYLEEGKFDLAEKHFLLSAQEGDPNAYYFLGVMYEVGDVVPGYPPANIDKAVKYFSLAALQGDLQAIASLKELDKPQLAEAASLVLDANDLMATKPGLGPKSELDDVHALIQRLTYSLTNLPKNTPQDFLSKLENIRERLLNFAKKFHTSS